MIKSENPLQQSLEHLFYAVAEVLCDDFVLDCSNGMTLRDWEGYSLAGGPNDIAKYIMKYLIKENKNEGSYLKVSA